MKDKTRKIIESEIWEYIEILTEERNLYRLNRIEEVCNEARTLILKREYEEWNCEGILE